MKPARIDAIPGLKEEVAKAFAENLTQQEIADIAGVSDRGTVAEWLKRDDVQQLVTKYIQERSNGILRGVDSRVEKILQSGKELTLEKLLKIRQTYGGQQVKLDLGGDQASILEDFLRQLHADPAEAEKAMEALDRAQPDPD